MDKNDLVIYTDGSVKENAQGVKTSGSGILFCRGLNKLNGHYCQTETSSIAYAELFAVYKAIKLIQNKQQYMGGDIHFFVDSMYVKNILCGQTSPKKYTRLIQDIQHSANQIDKDRNIFIHWIPSHLETHTNGKCRIEGNIEADWAANLGRESDIKVKNYEILLNEILDKSIELVWNISMLVLKNDGPSSDNFSSADANRITLRSNLRHS